MRIRNKILSTKLLIKNKTLVELTNGKMGIYNSVAEKLVTVMGWRVVEETSGMLDD
jgi:hypothetical protein